MARSLAANLSTALDRDVHEPAISLTSQNYTDTIPFDGNAFNFSDDYTWRPYMIYHSSGRLCALTREKTTSDSNDDNTYFIYTDTDRTTFTRVEISGLDSGVEGNIDYLALVEKADNNLGVIMARFGNADSTGTIYHATISVTGTVITSPTSITTYPRDADGAYGCTGLSINRMSNGTYYCVYCYTTLTGWAIYKLTSADYSSWTGPTQISPSGLTTGSYEEVEGVYIFEDLIENNDVFLLFGYTDDVQDENNKIFNIYSMLSADYGSTWGAPAARTAYTDLGSSAASPVVVQKSSGEVFLAFHERNTVLRMDENTSGWQDSAFGSCPAYFTVRSFYYNSATGNITCSFGRTSGTAGTKILCGVLIIDMDTWVISKIFNQYSSPPLNQAFADEASMDYCAEFAQGTNFVCVLDDLGELLIMLLDVSGAGFTVKYYCVCVEGSDPWSSYGLYGNITIPTVDPASWWPGRTESLNTKPAFAGVCLNETDGDKIYILWRSLLAIIYDNNGYHIGYIDTTESPNDEGEYTMNWVGSMGGTTWSDDELTEMHYINVLDDDGYIVVGSGGSASFDGGVALHYSTSGALVSEYTTSATSGFPKHGPYLSRPRYYNNHIYFNIRYNSGASYLNQRGMCDINTATGGISYRRPTWATANDYNLFGYYAVDTTNGYLYMAPYSEVVTAEWVTAARYNIASQSWTPYTNVTQPGMPATYAPSRGQNIFYDSVTGNVGVGLGYITGSSDYQGCIMFNPGNDFNQLKYLTASYAAGWTWDAHGSIALLAQSTTSSNAACAVDTDDVWWVYWDNYSSITNEYTLYWDRDMGEYSLKPYVTGPVKVKWEIKKPNEITFSLVNGHLFDPQNRLSALRDIVQKGQLITLRLGENYQGTEYLENQGQFIVVSTKLQYSKKQLPRISVRAQSRSQLWKGQTIVATTLYSNTPDEAIENILSNHAQMDASDYSIPTFASEHTIEHQFVDQEIWDMIEEICDHWFYVMYDDHDGVFTCVRANLDTDRAIDHTYSDNGQIAEFSPQDEYSDFTNSVRVTGEPLVFTDQVLAEELITTIAGTVGWYETNQEQTIHYSGKGESEIRKVRSPRLRIIQSIQFQGLLVRALATGEGGESISEEDPNETYCVVKIEMPDLIGAVTISIAVTIAVGISSIGCDGFVTGYCGARIAALAVALSVTMYLLSAVANYQYELYGQPLGQVKQSIQSTADDSVHQQNLGGSIIRKDIDDPLCYSVSECSRVAQGNLEVVQAQRNRVSFKKAAHMADEILDKIQVVHPYSAEAMDIVITGITRTYKKGSGSGAGMWDEIEGWRVD